MHLLLGALNPDAFEIFSYPVKWYGIIIATGVLLAVIFGLREYERRQISTDDMTDIILWSLPAAIIGARLYYVIFKWPYYADNPSEIIMINHGGLAFYGGLIGAAVVVILLTRMKLLPIWLVLDVAAPFILLAQAIGRWGNFMNQEAYGARVSLSFLKNLHIPNFIIEQMYINGAYHQPTFLYESLWSFIGFVILISLRHKKGLFKQGEIFLSYIMWYSFSRFFIEGMRTDSLYFLGFRVSQWLSLVFFIAALFIWIYRRKHNLKLKYYLDGSGFKPEVKSKKATK